MEIEYSFPGPIKIELDDADLSSVRSQGFCMDRNGFLGIESKTWLRTDSTHRYASATIDGDGDLNVWIPNGGTSPVEVERERIKPGNNVREDGIVEHFLADGSIVVTWPR